MWKEEKIISNSNQIPMYLKHKILTDCKLVVSIGFTTTNCPLKKYENEANEADSCQLHSHMRSNA